MNPTLASAVRAARMENFELPPRVVPPAALVAPARARLAWTAPRVDEASLSMRALLHLVAQAHGVGTADIRGPSRRHSIVYVRQEFYWRAARGKQSYKQIGAHVGRRDHTTVLQGVRQHCLRCGLPMPRAGVDPAMAVERKRERHAEWHRTHPKAARAEA